MASAPPKAGRGEKHRSRPFVLVVRSVGHVALDVGPRCSTAFAPAEAEEALVGRASHAAPKATTSLESSPSASPIRTVVSMTPLVTGAMQPGAAAREDRPSRRRGPRLCLGRAAQASHGSRGATVRTAKADRPRDAGIRGRSVREDHSGGIDEGQAERVELDASVEHAGRDGCRAVHRWGERLAERVPHSAAQTVTSAATPKAPRKRGARTSGTLREISSRAHRRSDHPSQRS